MSVAPRNLTELKAFLADYPECWIECSVGKIRKTGVANFQGVQDQHGLVLVFWGDDFWCPRIDFRPRYKGRMRIIFRNDSVTVGDSSGRVTVHYLSGLYAVDKIA